MQSGHVGGVKVEASSLTIQGGSFVASGAVALTNESATVTAYVGATTSDASGTVTQDIDLDLPPGQSYTLPAPPSGQRWTVVTLTRPQVRRIIGESSAIGLGVLVLAGYGGWKLWQGWSQRHRA